MDALKLIPIEWPDETNKLYIFIGEYFNYYQKLEIVKIAIKPVILEDGLMSFKSTMCSGFIHHDAREGETNIHGKRFGKGQFYKIIENDDAGDWF